jgi:membrane-bound lytic murein transglycosylase D
LTGSGVGKRRALPAVLAIVASAALAGCVSAPEPGPTEPQDPTLQIPAGSHTPAIPDPVPVTVGPQLSPSPGAEEELAAVVPLHTLPEHVLAEPPLVQQDLLDRMRAGMSLPPVKNSRIDREAAWYARNPEYIERTFTRAAPYLQYIVGEVEARGMPLELALLPVIESAFEPYAYSRARAVGLWQFMPLTGSRFSLKQDWWYDGRRDVVSATQAALDYLQYLHEMFDGDWLLAIGAYNCGEGNVSRAVKANRRAGRKIDFFSLKLPAETRGYVPRLLAMSRLVANPEDFGLEIVGMRDEPYFVRVETGGQINMAVAAELSGITTEEMYALNPAHHRWATDPTGPHFLLVPVESAEAFRQGLLQLTPDQRMRVERYEVRPGDTTASIAQRFGTTAQQLQMLNGLDSSAKLVAGSELRVPSSVTALPEKVLQAAARVDSRGSRARGGTVHVVRRGDTLWLIARQNGMSVSQLARLNGLDPEGSIRAGQKLKLGGQAASKAQPVRIATTDPSDPNRVTYVVQRGDTLSGIARSLRVSVANLRAWNSLQHDQIKPGQRLVAYVGTGS